MPRPVCGDGGGVGGENDAVPVTVEQPVSVALAGVLSGAEEVMEHGFEFDFSSDVVPTVFFSELSTRRGCDTDAVESVGIQRKSCGDVDAVQLAELGEAGPSALWL